MSEKERKLLRKFFMGNGITTTDCAKAANDLLCRDHEKVLRVLKKYRRGKLGAYFVPPMFISEIPEVIEPDQYNAKTENQGKQKDIVRGQIAEQKMFHALKEHFDDNKDDVLIIHSHKFLDGNVHNEKDFVLLNLTKGYLMVLEVKASQSKYQTAKRQLSHAKEKIEEIFAALGITSSKWKYVGVFFAQHGSEKPLFTCNNCSKYAIIGPENIAQQLTEIELEIMKREENWNPHDHVTEFVDIVKQLLFIAQGDPYAPVQ